MFNSIRSFRTNTRFEPNIENPDIAAAFADKKVLFLITLSESRMIIGARLVPMNDDMIFVRTFVWFAAVSLSRNISDRACPDVPEEVNVLTISSFGTLHNSIIPNS